jgi:adenylate cyclase
MTEQSEAWSAQRLAAETGTGVDWIADLVAAGVLQPVGPDEFRPGDVQRVLVADAMEQAGLTLEELRHGIRLGLVSFDQTDVIYPDPGPRSTGTVADLAASLDLSTDVLLRIITALGLPRPDAGSHLHVPDEVQLREFVRAWRALGGEELLVRAARVYGDALRRAAEGWMGLFEEAVLGPIAGQAIPWTEMSRRALEPGLPVLRVGTTMLPWLLDQHRVQALNRLNFDSIERMLTISGVAASTAPRPAAIVFADLAGYTRLTEERGDEVAADAATRLAVLADDVAQRHDGRLVKLLGDGVMLHFPRPVDAPAAALALRDAMAPAGLPPTHTGIHAGAVIRRESDYYGSTVNVAARLAAHAGAGEVLVTAELVAAVRDAGGALPELVPTPDLDLKGISLRPSPEESFG